MQPILGSQQLRADPDAAAQDPVFTEPLPDRLKAVDPVECALERHDRLKLGRPVTVTAAGGRCVGHAQPVPAAGAICSVTLLPPCSATSNRSPPETAIGGSTEPVMTTSPARSASPDSAA